MKLLLDTHLLLWAAGEPKRLSGGARALIDDPANELFFSPASLWEVVIKSRLGRHDFKVHGYCVAVFSTMAITNSRS